MRFIFKLLIGMIIFNAFLFIFTAEFGDSGGQDIDALENTDADYDIDSANFAVSVVTVGGGIFLVGTLASFFTKNPAWTGAGVLCSIIYTLYAVGTNPIANLFERNDMVFAVHIWNIFTFVFGVIAVIAVVEVFTGRSVDD